MCEDDLIDYVYWWDRHFYLDTFQFSGYSSKIINVSPDIPLTMTSSGSVDDTNQYCPGCIVQFYLGLDNSFNKCLGNSMDDWSFNESQSFTAPNDPGVYFINLKGSLQFSCLSVLIFSQILIFLVLQLGLLL